jgi:hypothetical protein
MRPRREWTMSIGARRWFWSLAIVVAILVGVGALYLLWMFDFTTDAGGTVHGILGVASTTPPHDGKKGAIGVNPIGMLITLGLTLVVVLLVGTTVILSLVKLILSFRTAARMSHQP